VRITAAQKAAIERGLNAPKQQSCRFTGKSNGKFLDIQEIREMGFIRACIMLMLCYQPGN